MKYLGLRELENVTSALNFRTSDYYIVGSCDLYTTKAAKRDKKLYKSIESSLESQHKSLVRLAESLSPANAAHYSMNLSRSSPFGSLSQVSNRRTFAYLVATLNASHPDYEFSHFLKPSDFRQEESLRHVMNTVDETLNNLRPRQAGALLAMPAGWVGGAVGPQTPGGSQAWGPRMWKVIDQEMSLRDCEIYCYAPDEDPFDGEDSAIWSLNHFFFNKARKRVCYMHIRGLSMSSHSPSLNSGSAFSKRSRGMSGSLSTERLGASKRAKFWLGDRADQAFSQRASTKGRSDDADVIAEPGDDEVDADEEEWGPSDMSLAGFTTESEEEEEDEDNDDDDDDELEQRYRMKSGVRRMSEHIKESMEV